MTTTSFNTRSPGYGESYGTPCAATDKKTDASLRDAYAFETQRMKEFAGRRRFQAPVADDFARGMLPGPAAAPDVAPPQPVRAKLASVMLGLKALCSGRKVQTPASAKLRPCD